MSDRPVVYLAHRLSGNWEENIADARLWVRAALEKGYAPVAPYLEDYDVLHEPEDRDLGIAHDLAVLERCEGLILCGTVVSPGMQLEREKAREIGIPVWHIATRGGIPEVVDFDLMKTETVLQEADRLINGDRQEGYGHPLDDMSCTGRGWGALVESWFGAHGQPGFRCPDLPAELVALMMDFVKASRESRHHKHDNCVDGPGYWGCVDLIVSERQRRSTEKGSEKEV